MSGQWGKDEEDVHPLDEDRGVHPLDDVAPSVHPLKHKDKSVLYHRKRPERNYSQFKAEYVDQHGREYALARDPDWIEEQGDTINNSAFNVPLLTRKDRIGRLLFNLRMPISQRWEVPLPDTDGEPLRMYHVATQVVCTGVTDGVFVAGGRARTGYVFVRRFVTHGQVADPAEYETSLRKDRTDKASF